MALSFKFKYDGENIVLELNGNNEIRAFFLHGEGIDNPLLTVQNIDKYSDEHGAGRLYYYTKDHLGSITGLVDKNGKLVQSYKYSAYGKTEVKRISNNTQEKIIENRFTYTAREQGVSITSDDGKKSCEE